MKNWGISLRSLRGRKIDAFGLLYQSIQFKPDSSGSPEFFTRAIAYGGTAVRQEVQTVHFQIIINMLYLFNSLKRRHFAEMIRRKRLYFLEMNVGE
ncbi:hypothetical protein DHW03_07520 [Pedobacter yonginense]|uniref:Uncharacterized protein n=1 Tax=Pedobacter yonginense TaxID=651869 RepID=A0A317EQ69_9SPHI|nr:hypothetical protein DHW03_07520 [Pedobacter yonginense]